MKKNGILFTALWQILIPAICGTAITILYCIVSENYLYLDYWLDFLPQVLYDASYIILSVLLFLQIGMLFASGLIGNIKSLIGTAIQGTAGTLIVPMIMFLSRIPFMGTEANAQEYFLSDVYCALQNSIRFLLALLILISAKLYCKAEKLTPTFEKPYVIPKGVIQLISCIYYSAWIIISFIGFITSETKNVTSLITEIIYAVSGYYFTVLGAYIYKRFYKSINKI